MRRHRGGWFWGVLGLCGFLGGYLLLFGARHSGDLIPLLKREGVREQAQSWLRQAGVLERIQDLDERFWSIRLRQGTLPGQGRWYWEVRRLEEGREEARQEWMLDWADGGYPLRFSVGSQGGAGDAMSRGDAQRLGQQLAGQEASLMEMGALNLPKRGQDDAPGGKVYTLRYRLPGGQVRMAVGGWRLLSWDWGPPRGASSAGEPPPVPSPETRGGVWQGFMPLVGALPVLASLLVGLVGYLKRGEVDWGPVLTFGALAMILALGAGVLRYWPSWLDVLYSGSIGAFLMGVLAVVVAIPVGGELRSQAPERLAVLDQMLLGRWHIRELGLALGQALFLAGITALWVVFVSLWLAPLAGGELRVQAGWFWDQMNLRDWLGMGTSDILLRCLFFLPIWLVWWPHMLRRRWLPHHPGWAAVFWGMGALALLPLPWFSWERATGLEMEVLLWLPLVALWFLFVVRIDPVGLGVGGVLAYAFLQGWMGLVIPGEGPGYWGKVLLLVLLLLLLASWYLGRYGSRVAELGRYRPGYIHRIAEAERVSRELEIARQVQLDFLPFGIPQVPGLDVAALCVPAQEVGGDLYDVWVDDAGTGVTFWVGDVSGKGVSAAFYMTMLKGILHTLRHVGLMDPDALLRNSNHLVWRTSPPRVFVTSLVVRFLPERNVLEVGNGGHNPLLLVAPGGEATWVRPTARALGLRPDVGRAGSDLKREMPWREGLVAVLYTDGITEAMNPDGEVFGEERLLEAVRRVQELSAHEILEAVRAAVTSFARGSAQGDDQTLIVVKGVGSVDPCEGGGACS